MLPSMALRIHRAERTDLLADGLARLLSTPLADPLAEEVVVVPARGVERWLTQRLSHRLGVGFRGGDGVCAGVRFLSPHSLVALLLDREHDDPWNPDRMVWPLLAVIDDSMAEPWCEPLARHLGYDDPTPQGDLRRSRRYSVARRMAGLFASYAAQRPQLVTDWRQGRDTDGAGGRLDDDLRWQPELWRRLLDRIPEPAPDLRQADTVRRLAGGATADLRLPPRLSLFGHTRLPVTEVQLLGALGRARDVHLWLPQPSARLWDDLAEVSATGPVPRRDDRSAAAVHHPLLASLGRDSRELQRSLAAHAHPVEDIAQADEAGADRPALLSWLQQDLRGNTAPDQATRQARMVREDDRSVQVHACHGAARQIDVLREVLVGLLEDDHTLEPRDILVLCPDIETYAPLIQAGFGLADITGTDQGHPAHRLRVRLADRALPSTNPLLALAGTLVELAAGRVTASQVLDLAATGPVRRRFGFTDEDLAQLTLWVDQAAIRWGLDEQHRQAGYDLPLDVNTWRFGLHRILLGVAMAEDDGSFLGRALPVDDVASGDIDLAGRLAELVERLHDFVRRSVGASTVGEWTAALADAVSRLGTVDAEHGWQLAQFDRELGAITEAARDQAVGRTPLTLSDVRTLLSQRLGGRPTRANFRTGTLTVCTMVPMRSVPHRVVCLVGLDDGVFPRRTAVDGDDVLARDPITGERDARSEDRQLLLDAILAATETLVVTYSGANEHTGAPRPPAVPLGELLDALDDTAIPGATAKPVPGRETDRPQSVRDQVLSTHPLQPFDPGNFTSEAPDGRPFSFDAPALAGAEAARIDRSPPGPLLPGPLPAQPVHDVELVRLREFVVHPARAFLRGRLGVGAPLKAEETLDAIPIELDNLQKWQAGDRLLTDLLRGADAEDSMTAEQLRGLLPPGQLGERALTQVCENLQPLLETTLRQRQGDPRGVDVDIDLGDGRRLTGTVTGLFGNRLVTATYSRLSPRHRLPNWVDLLALSVAHPDQSWTACCVGRATSGAGVSANLAGPLDHLAEVWLRDLIDLYDRGMREPVPLPLRTASAWADARARQRQGEPDVDPKRLAGREWQTDRHSDRGFPKEDADPAHVRVYGEHAPLDVLLGPPAAGENWYDTESCRLGQYAWRLWSPLLLGAERVNAL